MSRHVMVLQGSSSTLDVMSALASNQWLSRRVTHPNEVTPPSGEEHCHVGLAVFDGALTCSPSEFTRVAERSNMEWIAVVPRDSARDPATARALAWSFFDFHTLPVDITRLLYSVGHAHGKGMLRSTTRAGNGSSPQGRLGMIGQSARMLRLYSELEKVTQARMPVLITGESGVGKELAARAIHRGSARSREAFIAINCGALPQSLVESLLFGHEKGAFTGAHERRLGSIEAANRGTVFLDEIGDLPAAAQASLLRFLQESTIVRVGSTRELPIDTRVIAATHMDLRAAARAGHFRKDLFYRLNVLTVDVPALRERSEDRVLLAEHFLRLEFAGRTSATRDFSQDALDAIKHHDWPGNVRELLNRVQRATVMCEGPLITAQDLQLDSSPNADGSAELTEVRDDAGRVAVEAALGRSHYNVAAAARKLGISRVTLYRIIKRLQIPLRERGRNPAARDFSGVPDV
jgi:DNA-binding NtrC family response regulator